MATTKKTTIAKNQQDVDELSAKDRLWDSLDYTYGQKREQSDKAYDEAIAASDRQLMSRGMQRSSYGAQTLANMQQKKIEAGNDIESQKIADYENRLAQVEQQDLENERWEKQFAAERDDSMWNRAFQQNQADRSQANWQAEFGANRSDAAFNQGMQTQQFNANREDTAWNQAFQQKQFAANQEQNAWQRGMTERQYADSRSDTAWSQNMQQQQFAAQQEQNAWQRGMTERQYADSRSDTAWQQAFQREQYDASRADTAWQQAFNERQWQAQQDQWREQFDYNKMSAEQQLNYNWVTYALQNGKDVSDDMLAKAGLSRADFTAMKQQVSGGGGPGKKKDPWEQLGITEEEYNRLYGNPGSNTGGMTFEEFMNLFNQNGSQGQPGNTTQSSNLPPVGQNNKLQINGTTKYVTVTQPKKKEEDR